MTARDTGEIGRRRKALRVIADLTQEELAERAGVSKMTVWNAEAGRSASEATIRSLARVLGVSAAEYLGPDLDEEPSPAPAHACGGAS